MGKIYKKHRGDKLIWELDLLDIDFVFPFLEMRASLEVGLSVTESITHSVTRSPHLYVRTQIWTLPYP